MSKASPTWEELVFEYMRDFARRYNTVYAKKERVLSAYFEIGCFLALVKFYEAIGFSGEIKKPDANNSYKYLTTPSGNPENFSYMLMSKKGVSVEIRQQVRIVSHIGVDIAFTPDIVVIPENTEINRTTDSDYAGGKRGFFYVTSDQVIAAHECKSLSPFPELLVSFIGTVVAAHQWIENDDYSTILDANGDHLAPSLFVGGTSRALHLRMIKGLKDAYPMNIIVGMHFGTWNLLGDHADVRRINNPLFAVQMEDDAVDGEKQK